VRIPQPGLEMRRASAAWSRVAHATAARVARCPL